MSPSKLSFTKVFAALGLSLALLFGVVAAASATTGVGIGTGKIRLDKPLSPGLTYTLPAITVFNTGDTKSDYRMSVTYNEKQPEAKPKEKWFTFKPKEFRLSPHKSQSVTVKLKPSTWSAKPGKYFAYLEAEPVIKEKGGTASLKVAAATKLNFEIKPANAWQRTFYGLQAFWEHYRLLIIAILFGLAVAEVVRWVRRNVKIELRAPAKRAAKKPKRRTAKPARRSQRKR